MGDRYELVCKCRYCKEINKDIWYAPTCGFLTFKCKKCKKENFITSDFIIKKLEDVTYEDVWYAISNASNMMTNKQIEDYAKQLYNELKKKGKYGDKGRKKNENKKN